MCCASQFSASWQWPYYNEFLSWFQGLLYRSGLTRQYFGFDPSGRSERCATVGSARRLTRLAAATRTGDENRLGETPARPHTTIFINNLKLLRLIGPHRPPRRPGPPRPIGKPISPAASASSPGESRDADMRRWSQCLARNWQTSFY